MTNELDAALRSAKDLLELADKGHSAAESAKIFTAIAELNIKLFAAQRAIFSLNETKTALSDRIQHLEAEKAVRDQWDYEMQDYELREVCAGFIARVWEGAKPPYKDAVKYCSRCFDRRVKTALQCDPLPEGGIVLSCYVCKTEHRASEYLL